MEELLRRQWEALRTWLDAIDLDAEAARPTGLVNWTVADLVAHLGLGLGLAAEVRGVQYQDRALSVGEYVAAYPGAAAEIAAMTRRTRTDLGSDTLAGLDAIAQHVWSTLARSDEAYVLARRGPIRRSDYLLTRLLELVVHGEDLWRVLGGASPVLPDALSVVSTALVQAYGERTGTALDPDDELAWVRLACGRQPSDDPALPLL